MKKAQKVIRELIREELEQKQALVDYIMSSPLIDSVKEDVLCDVMTRVHRRMKEGTEVKRRIILRHKLMG